MKYLSAITIVVPDYDDAIAFYVGVLGFELCEDTKISDTKRWVTVMPPGGGPQACRLLLAKADGDHQHAAIGNQAGGRVFLFLKTDNFDGDYQSMLSAGVKFTELPRDEPYGKVVVFEDPFGNRWDLLEA